MAINLLNFGVIGYAWGDGVDPFWLPEYRATVISSGTKLPVIYANEEAKKKFKKEDEERSKEYLDTHGIHKEASGDKALIELKKKLSVIPSHVLERYKSNGGVLEYNSLAFTTTDISKGIVAKVDVNNKRKIFLNTHIEERDYSLLKKDFMVKLITQQKSVLEYERYSAPSASQDKKAALLDSYKDFIKQVFADEDASNPAKDFFFGENSPFHKFNNANNISSIDIERNIDTVQNGIAKAITYHGEMNSLKGNSFLSSRFPGVNKLISEIYFEPHGKSSPHLTDKNIPNVLVKTMEVIQDNFNVSASAFDPDYVKYVSSERLGKYIAARSDITDSYAQLALRNISNTSKPINSRREESLKTGIGDCNVQAVNLAAALRDQGISADVCTLSNRNLSHSVVYAKMADGSNFFVDPWAGIIVPQEQYNQYYSDFPVRNIDMALNKLIVDVKLVGVDEFKASAGHYHDDTMTNRSPSDFENTASFPAGHHQIQSRITSLTSTWLNDIGDHTHFVTHPIMDRTIGFSTPDIIINYAEANNPHAVPEPLLLDGYNKPLYVFTHYDSSELAYVVDTSIYQRDNQGKIKKDDKKNPIVIQASQEEYTIREYNDVILKAIQSRVSANGGHQDFDSLVLVSCNSGRNYTLWDRMIKSEYIVGSSPMNALKEHLKANGISIPVFAPTSPIHLSITKFDGLPISLLGFVSPYEGGTLIADKP